MSLAAAIANDCDSFDGTESGTLRRVRSGGGEDVAVASVTSSPLSYQQALALGGAADLDGETKNFSLNVTDVGASGVRRGDNWVRSDGSVWEIISADLATLGTRWKCVARRMP